MRSELNGEKCQRLLANYANPFIALISSVSLSILSILDLRMTGVVVSDAKRLQAIYEREVNFEITVFFDNGIVVDLGDNINGRGDGDIFDTFEEAIDWLDKKTMR